MKETIIKDIDGKRLRLLETRIVEVEPGYWSLPFAELRRGLKRSTLRIYRPMAYNNKDLGLRYSFSLRIDFNPRGTSLGCHTFSRYTFNKILKAAGAR
jgi:hypothetical protein